MKIYLEILSILLDLSFTNLNMFGAKLVWKPRTFHNAFIAHTSLLAYHDNIWLLKMVVIDT